MVNKKESREIGGKRFREKKTVGLPSVGFPEIIAARAEGKSRRELSVERPRMK